MWTGEQLKYNHFKIFGEKMFVLDKDPQKEKLAAGSREGIFVGYPRATKGYRAWIPSERKVVARDVKFLEEQSRKKVGVESADNLTRDTKDFVGEQIMSEGTPEGDVESIAKEEKAINTPERNSPASRVRNSIPEIRTPERNLDSPASSIQTSTPKVVQRRGPGRPRILRTGSRGRPRKIYQTVDTEEEGLVDSDEIEDDVFTNFCGVVEISMDEAMSSEEKEKWEDTFYSEIKSLVKNDTWEIVTRLGNENVVGCRFVLTHKYGPGGEIERKARLVAKGYSQRYGVDAYLHAYFCPSG